MMAKSKSSPANLMDSLAITSPAEMTAKSLVPPPISMTILPDELSGSIPAPTPATFGSSSK